MSSLLDKSDTAQKVRWLAVFACCLMAVSLIFSPFLLSAGMWFLVAAALWQCSLSVRGAGAVLRLAFLNFFRDKNMLALSLLFVVTTLSGLWSDNLDFWLERTRVRIPFFVLPFAFANLPALEERQQKGVLYLLVWALVLTCIGVGINYWLHFQEIMRGMYEGRPIPVPRNHIRFNLILATGIICGGWLSAQRFCLRYAWEWKLTWVATVFLFVFIHVLSVRSGLAALYLALLFSLVWFVFKTKKWFAGALLLATMLALPLLAVKLLPSVAQKVEYMSWDWKQLREADGDAYSDSGRMVSLLGGWQLVKENPFFGVGTGDLPSEMRRFAEAEFPIYAPVVKEPHNQFLYILAATGIFGLALSLFGLYRPLFTGAGRGYLFGAFQCIAFTSFLVEYTLETAIGVAFFLFFQIWFLRKR